MKELYEPGWAGCDKYGDVFKVSYIVMVFGCALKCNIIMHKQKYPTSISNQYNIIVFLWLDTVFALGGPVNFTSVKDG